LPQILAAIFQALITGIGALVSSLAEGFGNLFGPIGEAIGSFFSGVWETLCNGAQAAWEGIMSIFSGIAEWFGNIFRNAWAAVKAVFETGGKIFSGIVEGIIATFKTVVNGIISGINTVVAIPFNAINGFLNILKSIDILGFKPFDWVGTIAVPQIPLLAQGGYANGATGAVIGEAGSEVVLPLSQNTDNWSGLLASALAEKFNEEDYGAGRGIVIENQNFNIDSRLDAENIGHIMMQSIRRQAR
jgi:phage-related minor tail protein